MVSPFDVYLVMQLDAIRGALGAFGLVASVGAAFVAIFCATEARSQWSWDKETLEDRIARFAGYSKTAKRVLVAGLLSGLLSVGLPSSKTAAAMILIPALTSKEVVVPVAAEAKELYGLAKEALRGLAERKPEPKPED